MPFSEAPSDKRKCALVLSLVFPPDAVSTAQLFGEVVEDLAAHSWRVVVLTTKPHYNLDQSRRQAQPLTDIWGGLLATSTFGGSAVLHTAMPKKNAGIAGRLAAWAGFHFLSVVAALFKVGRVDVILAPSPPLTIGIAAWLIGLIKGAPFIYNVQELYPDAAIRLGVLQEGVTARLLRGVERFVYRQAYAITTIAPRMHSAVVSRVSHSSKVRLIPNFVDTREIAPRPKDNPFSREFSLSDRFIVLYAGNMGPAQGLETLIDAAEGTRDHPRIVYVLVGGGTLRERLLVSVRAKGLPNVTFVPPQPYERMPDIYGASDLCLVPLARGLTAEAIPSKIYRIMAAERTVLALVDPDSDVAQVVRDSGSGIVVEAGDAIALSKAVLKAAADADQAPGKRGRQYVLTHASRDAVTRMYSDLLQEALDGRAGRATQQAAP